MAFKRSKPLARACAALVFACLAGGPAHAEISITVMGSWTEFIDQTDLMAGPGTNLNTTYTSATNANLVTISGAAAKNDAWQVYVKRIDTTWDSRLVLLARRTSSGKGPGSVSGGADFIQITPSDTLFFWGAGNLRDIQVQLRLTNMSLNIPVGQQTATVQYTVIDIP